METPIYENWELYRNYKVLITCTHLTSQFITKWNVSIEKLPKWDRTVVSIKQSVSLGHDFGSVYHIKLWDRDIKAKKVT